MGMFDWLFGTGDSVVDKKGNRGTVKGFKPEGFVEVKGKDGKVRTEFGGNLSPDDLVESMIESGELTDPKDYDY